MKKFKLFIILFLGYLLIRHALLDLHKMKDWPTVLFVSCFVVIAICFFIKKTIAPLITSISYVIGFALGYIFQSSGVDAGGGTTNNLWIIWTITIFVFVFLMTAGSNNPGAWSAIMNPSP